MAFSTLASLFKPKHKQVYTLDSLLMSKMKKLALSDQRILFANQEIFYHKSTHRVALLLYDKLYGIYIFEQKEWSYHDLKNATLQKTQSAEHASNTLAFNAIHTLIKQRVSKFFDQEIPVHNYLLMENLSSFEYEHLEGSIKELLVQERIIFSNLEIDEILKKLHLPKKAPKPLPDAATLLSPLFIQYRIMQENGHVALCNEEQRAFVDKPIEGICNLIAPAKSGKSSLLLLKTLVELHKHQKKIILIKPTKLAKNRFYKKFLSLIENINVTIDLENFTILTPTELIHKHLKKLNFPRLTTEVVIDPILMKKRFFAADLILCDDANLLDQSFVEYLKYLQKKEELLLVNDRNLPADIQLTQSYQKRLKFFMFYKTNPHAKTMLLLRKLLRVSAAEDIAVVCNDQSREKLIEDLNSFVAEEFLVVNANKTKLKKDQKAILLLTYNDIFEISAKHLIIMDLCFTQKDIIHHACSIAQETLHILYEEECYEIKQLKEYYEQSYQE